MNTVNFSSGVIFDTRSILISVSGLFFGYIPTIIAAVIISAYRILIGGTGAFTGVTVTVVTAGIGLIWHYFRINKILLKTKNPWGEFYLFGLITHIGMLLCMLTLPKYMISDVLKAMTMPILLLYPIGSLFLCMLIYFGVKNVQTKLNLEESELRFRTLVEEAPIGITLSKNNHQFYINSMYEKILGRTKEEIMNLGWEQITYPYDLNQEMEKYELLKKHKINTYSMVKRYIRGDGSIIWANMTVASLNINSQLGENNICMVQDISDLIKINENLKANELRYKNLYLDFENKQLLLVSLLNSMKDLIFYKDPEGIYLGCNEAFEKFVGKGREQIVGFTDFDLFGNKRAALFKQKDIEMLKQNSPLKNEELVPYSDGSMVWMETLKSPFCDSNGNVLGLIGVSRDITERKKQEEKILYLNYHDILTGLYNRTFFEKEKVDIDKEENLPLSVIIGDINGLKLINDGFSLEEGDKILIEEANILKSCIREGDILARTGGDEFTILLPKTDDIQANIVVDKIKAACKDYADEVGNIIYGASLSLGHATKNSMQKSFEEISRTAEEEMYRSKLLESKSMHSAIIASIKATLFEKNNETEKHGGRLGELSRVLGIELGLNEKEKVDLELVSTLHDIGKIGIDKNILEKSGKLSELEWHEIKKHPEIGYRIAKTVPELRNIAEYILCHHERWDGKGYPQGLSGENIPYLARALSILDSYDAMIEDRPYRKAMSKEAAIEEIRKNSGTQFDPEVAKIFVEKVLK
ncbi:MAG TPA: HD domain-containing phosphohydrolase, partial [Anaerovoracaceae bacterium]|nr:HD domain-containing phosphohydrolase [Anaerovoracaceae bacterium]